MITIFDMAAAYEDGKKQFEEILDRQGCSSFFLRERYGAEEAAPQGCIGMGDNLAYMEFLLKEKNMAGKIQLIYVDPPFFSSGKYQASLRLNSDVLGRSSVIRFGAYDDCWTRGGRQYLSMLAVRLMMMRELLSDTGCIWIHLDWHAVHSVKVLMDQIFGEKNIINEVIWTYKSGGSGSRSFARKHDTLLFYAKSERYKFNQLREKSYNRGMKPYRFKGVEEFRDETGWYTMVNMKDVWSIDMVGRTSAERTGYATQKPEKLLERIVTSCSEAGDLCADFFAGSGTLGIVCEKAGRRWIMCDEGGLAAAYQVERLGAAGACFEVERGQEENPQGILDIMVSDDKIELLGYRADLSQIPDKDTGELRRYLARDSLSMIRCWSVDTNYDGSVHRAGSVMDGAQRCRTMDEMPAGGSRISITGYDMLGNRFFRMIKA